MCQSKSEGGRRCAVHHPASRAMIAAMRAVHGLDMTQAEAVFKKTHDKAKAPKNPPPEAKWHAFVDEQIQAMALNMRVDTTDFDKAARKLNAAKAEIPDPQLWAAYKDYGQRMEKAVQGLRRQVNFAAAFRGVPTEVAKERYEAFRSQYLTDFAALPEADRPAPPAEWVTGFTTEDMMAVSTPADKATLYALYRCQADPDLYPGISVRYASIDLETAGPAGKEGFNPVNGSIIEVGIAEYDNDGNVTDRYESLIAPAPEVAATCGTGAVDVHGITMADVQGAPPWADIAPDVSARLEGRIMLAQNARFEGEWLGHHMSEAGQDFERYGPTLDTLCLAKQHLPALENHKLASICERVGVDYTNGHRALHDAEVAAQAFFAMRTHVFNEFRASTVAGRPVPALGSAKKRPSNGLTRLTAGDFSPATVVDPWTVEPVRTEAA